MADNRELEIGGIKWIHNQLSDSFRRRQLAFGKHFAFCGDNNVDVPAGR